MTVLIWNPKVMKKLQNKARTTGEKSSILTKEDVNKMCVTTSKALSCKAIRFPPKKESNHQCKCITEGFKILGLAQRVHTI